MQRSFLGVVSDVDAHEAREVGEKAVQFAIWHDVDGSVAIRRVGQLRGGLRPRQLEDVAAKTRHMPDEFINAEGNDVTEAFKIYARPLIGELAAMDRISAPTVHKIKGD